MIDCTNPPPYRVWTGNERCSIRITVSEPGTCCAVTVRTGWVPNACVTLRLTAAGARAGAQTAAGARRHHGERGQGDASPAGHRDS